MSIDRQKFIINKPVQLEFGTVNFLTIEDYIDLQNELGLIAMNNLHLFYAYKKQLKSDNEEQLNELRKLKEMSLYPIVVNDETLLSAYVKVFQVAIEFVEGFDLQYLFDDEDRFMWIRKIVMDMNLVKEDKVFKDERLQKGEEMKRKVENVKAKDKQTIEDVITSVVAKTANSFSDVNKMTVYQLHSLFARVNAIINYETTTLFKTVSNDIEVEDWSKHIDLLEGSQSKDMNRTDFERKFGEILS